MKVPVSHDGKYHLRHLDGKLGAGDTFHTYRAQFIVDENGEIATDNELDAMALCTQGHFEPFVLPPPGHTEKPSIKEQLLSVPPPDVDIFRRVKEVKPKRKKPAKKKKAIKRKKKK